VAAVLFNPYSRKYSNSDRLLIVESTNWIQHYGRYTQLLAEAVTGMAGFSGEGADQAMATVSPSCSATA
jgi:hypothetical protein